MPKLQDVDVTDIVSTKWYHMLYILRRIQLHLRTFWDNFLSTSDNLLTKYGKIIYWNILNT